MKWRSPREPPHSAMCNKNTHKKTLVFLWKYLLGDGDRGENLQGSLDEHFHGGGGSGLYSRNSELIPLR